jgi:hypothetical protein
LAVGFFSDNEALLDFAAVGQHFNQNRPRIWLSFLPVFEHFDAAGDGTNNVCRVNPLGCSITCVQCRDGALYGWRWCIDDVLRQYCSHGLKSSKLAEMFVLYGFEHGGNESIAMLLL